MLGKLLSTLQRCISTTSCRSDALFKIHPSVCAALAEHRPVVALESTIITHGMPYPQNLSTAKEVEDIVRAEGVTPATVAILEGKVHVGLSSDELDFLARSETTHKVSRRDLPYVISKGLSGGTTVSGTMIAAHKAGIPVFVTGGIGGVHRDGENIWVLPFPPKSLELNVIKDIRDAMQRAVEHKDPTELWRVLQEPQCLLPTEYFRKLVKSMPCGGPSIRLVYKYFWHFSVYVCFTAQMGALDVSADLTELGRTPIAVVSAGVKSILDIGRTLEYLETQGVCVATYGESKSFPAFFSHKSGYTSPYNVLNAEEAAELIASTLSLGFQSGVLLAVPIPAEHAAAGQQIEDAIQAAVTEARLKGISGRDVTPFILHRVNVLTVGQSLRANIALIHNNARVGSQIARALSERTNHPRGGCRSHEDENQASKHETIVVGGVNVDFIAKGTSKKLLFGQTNPGSVCQSFGGVGRNIADCLSRLGQKILFISAIGADSHSDAVINYCKHMDTRAVARLQGQRTATYCAVITESGELSLGLGDMDIHQEIKEQYVSQYEDQLSSASLVVLDGNIPVSTIDYICSLAKKHSVPVWYEPTDADKASKPFISESWKALSYTSPNMAELCTMNQTLRLPTPQVLPGSLEDMLECAAALSRPLLEHLHCVVVTLGAMGVLVCGEHEAGTVSLRPRKHKRKGRLCAVYYPALSVRSEETVNVSGAGDSLSGAMMAGILQGKDTDTCVRMGLLAARLSLFSPHPIAQCLTLDAILPHRVHPQPWPKPTCMWMES